MSTNKHNWRSARAKEYKSVATLKRPPRKGSTPPEARKPREVGENPIAGMRTDWVEGT